MEKEKELIIVSVERSEFEKIIKEDNFVEYAEYCGNLYGTPFGPIKEVIDSDRIFILAIDVKGGITGYEENT